MPEQPVMHTTDDGVQVWRLDGKLHRTDGPAVIDGKRQTWYLNGKRHRTDGPAIISGEYQVWWVNGKMNRTDGPAYIDGKFRAWYLNGVKYQFDEWLDKINATPEEKTMLRLKWAK